MRQWTRNRIDFTVTSTDKDLGVFLLHWGQLLSVCCVSYRTVRRHSFVGTVKLVAYKLAQSAHKVQLHVFGHLSRDLRIKQRAAPGGRSAKDAVAGMSSS